MTITEKMKRQTYNVFGEIDDLFEFQEALKDAGIEFEIKPWQGSAWQILSDRSLIKTEPDNPDPP